MNANNPNPIRIELESLEGVRKRLRDPTATWHDVVIQSVNLKPVDEALSKVAISGCHFLGCDIGLKLAHSIAKSTSYLCPGGPCLVFPKMPWLPFNPYRGSLYDAEELLGKFESEDLVKEKTVYEKSVDWLSYLTFADIEDTKPYTNDSVDVVLARRLHDTAISDALEELLAPFRIR